MIIDYINKKDNKKYWQIKNEYIGRNIFTGKEKRISKKGFKTKKEAVNHVAKVKSEFLEGGVYNANTITFYDVYKLFNDSYKGTVKESTYQQNTSTYDKIILPALGNIKLISFNVPFCQKYINELAKNHKKHTVTRYKTLVNMVLEYAVKLEMISKNSMKYVNIPIKQEEKKENYYTKEELFLFLDIVKANFDFKIYTIFHVLAFTGLRCGELSALTWQDINFKEKTLTVNKNMVYIYNKGIAITTPKTQTSNRVVYLDNTTIAVLKEYRKSQGVTSVDSNFFNVKNARYIDKKLKDIYVKFPKLKKITPHGFRHTHATLLFESDINVKDTSNRLGHSNISTTLNLYTHLSDDRKKDTTEKFEKYMSL